jgi:Mannanase, galactose-binding domain-like
MSSPEPPPTSFWATARGILTALAALVTIMAGLVTTLSLTGVLDLGDEGSGTPREGETAVTSSLPNPSPSSSAAIRAIRLASFERDTEGWRPQPRTTADGSTSTASDYSTHGTHSLQVDPTGEGWFGTEFTVPYDVSGKSAVSADLKTVRGSTPTNLAIQLKVGDDYVWCQSSTDLVANGTGRLDFGTMACSVDGQPVDRPSDLTQLTAVWLYLHEGSFRVDNVRAE